MKVDFEHEGDEGAWAYVVITALGVLVLMLVTLVGLYWHRGLLP